MIIFEEQDLGELSQTVRQAEQVSTKRDVELLHPDADKTHGEAMEAFRDVIEEYYSERLDELTDDGEQLIITRANIVSNDVPMIEYAVVDEL